MDSNLINLKCIDDFNNKLSLLLKTNINNLLEITNINYTIDIPQSNLFSETSNIILERTDNRNNYNKTMLFDPYD
jgi:hypothetical protein|tara:strand:+ start:1104 stop:1328 length:225 start_codon:yes stop_codon:yes gene_type:complete